MSVTLAELTTPIPRSSFVSTGLAVLSALRFPVTSWHAFGAGRGLLEAAAGMLVEVSAMVAEAARGATLTTARGGWLDLFGEDWLGTGRKSSEVTQGTITLTEASGSARTWAAGEIVVRHRSTGLIFRSVDAASVIAGGTVSVLVAAEAPGAAYNVGGEGLELVTAEPGVYLSAATAEGWISRSGRDEESDEDYRERLRTVIAALVPTGTREAYVRAAVDGVAGITGAAVVEDPSAAPGSPSVTVYGRTDAGPLSASELAELEAAVEAVRPLGILVSAQSAAAATFDLRGEVYFRAGSTAAEGQVDAAIRALFAATEIGGTVRIADLYELILSTPGVVNARLLSTGGVPLVPVTDDVVLSVGEVPTLINHLTWTAV